MSMKRQLLMDLGAARTRIVRVGDSRLWNEPRLAVINGVGVVLPQLDYLQRR